MNPDSRAKKGGGEPPRKKRPRIQFDPDEMLDVHLRLGLEDHHIRIGKAQWGLLIENWVVAGEDVVLRCSHKNHERNIILRGSSGGFLSIQGCDPEKNIPVYNVFSVVEMRKEMLRDQGIE